MLDPSWTPIAGYAHATALLAALATDDTGYPAHNQPPRRQEPQKGGRHTMTSSTSSKHYQQGTMIGEITRRFAGVTPDEFRTNMHSLWEAAQSITQSVADEVESERITPIQGASVVANVTGSLFGWPEFHRELRPSDLAVALIGNGVDGQ